MLDIFEALTTGGRPYKKSMSPEQAFGILHSMCEAGQLDGSIVDVFEKSRSWENPEKDGGLHSQRDKHLLNERKKAIKKEPYGSFFIAKIYLKQRDGPAKISLQSRQ